MKYIENIVIGKPLVDPFTMLTNGTVEDWNNEFKKTYYTNERYLPKILKNIGLTKSTSEIRRNRKDLCVTLDKLDFLEIKLGKKKLWILVGEKMEDKFSDVYKVGEEFAKELNLKDSKDAQKVFKNTYVEADTEKVKQAIDKCTKKHEKLLRKLGSE